ncbi:RNA-binding protein 45 isoform X2 [Adelges cooleyi]|uniref:RNA-binding protein 45 isoform X2 n=1 Tax=Adelges cooleyi TaxID=133065 RepID=UPI00217FCE85|nr:RNA-binding protein 45 isoform X2 [Adelges cooleyi]
MRQHRSNKDHTAHGKKITNTSFNTEQDEQNDTNEPENSRIFVLYDKNNPISENEFSDMFGKFGVVQNIYIVKDRNNDSVKGVAYIKYSKASEAFKAIEEMNGYKMESTHRRMKVLMATSPGQTRSTSEMEYNRLFVFVPKSEKEPDLENYFSQYGDVSKVHIVTNKDSGESKGIAFITFNKASSAALAIEQCGSNYKAVFAKPKHEDGPSAYPTQTYNRHSDSKTSNYALLAPSSLSRRDDPIILNAYTSPIVTYNELYRILNIAPELEQVKELPRQQGYEKKMFQVVYNTASAADHAVNRINGFEYPPGHPIMLEFSSSTSLSIPSAVDPLVASKITKDIEVLSSTVNKALAVIKETAERFKIPDEYNSPSAPKRRSEIPLLQSPDNIFRLFFVCKPVIPSVRLLDETFRMFKGLRNINVIDGKNYGYVTYDNPESATRAIDYLNDNKLYNSRLKVMEAEPREPNRKRLKQETV